MGIKSLIRYQILLIFALCMFSGCRNSIKDVKIDTALPKYSEVTAIEKKDNSFDIYKVQRDGLYKIGSRTDNVIELTYSSKGNSIAELVYLSQGQNLSKNLVNVYKDDKIMVLNNFYSARDLILNSSGDMLLYRSYEKDSIDSAVGLKIFDISSKTIINLSSKVLVSGNVYNWLDNNNILYYGSIQGVDSSGKIYKYNIREKKQEVYLENIYGYCLYLMNINDGILYLMKNGDQTNIDYYNSKNNNKVLLSSEISEIYSAKFSSKTNQVFFIGKGINAESPALYKISMESHKLVRLTYDFPKTIDIDSNISIDSSGNAYFTAMQGLYMYDYKNNSVNLISTHSGKYTIYDNVNN